MQVELDGATRGHSWYLQFQQQQFHHHPSSQPPLPARFDSTFPSVVKNRSASALASHNFPQADHLSGTNPAGEKARKRQAKNFKRSESFGTAGNDHSGIYHHHHYLKLMAPPGHPAQQMGTGGSVQQNGGGHEGAQPASPLAVVRSKRASQARLIGEHFLSISSYILLS